MNLRYLLGKVVVDNGFDTGFAKLYGDKMVYMFPFFDLKFYVLCDSLLYNFNLNGISKFNGSLNLDAFSYLSGLEIERELFRVSGFSGVYVQPIAKNNVIYGYTILGSKTKEKFDPVDISNIESIVEITSNRVDFSLKNTEVLGLNRFMLIDTQSKTIEIEGINLSRELGLNKFSYVNVYLNDLWFNRILSEKNDANRYDNDINKLSFIENDIIPVVGNTINREMKLVKNKDKMVIDYSREIVDIAGLIDNIVCNINDRENIIFDKSKVGIQEVFKYIADFIDCNLVLTVYIKDSKYIIFNDKNIRDNILVDIEDNIRSMNSLFVNETSYSVCMGIPYMDDCNEIIGIVSIFKRDISYWSYEERLRLIFLFDYLKELIFPIRDKYEVHVKALTDALTGLFNRRYLDEKLEGFKGQINKEIGITVCDLDGLKYINDTKGHFVGDIFIKEFAGILKRSFRKTDCIVRTGGDEFLGLVENITIEGLGEIINRINNEINIINNSRKYDFLISVSIGYITGDISECASLVKKADELMYANKSSKKSSGLKYIDVRAKDDILKKVALYYMNSFNEGINKISISEISKRNAVEITGLDSEYVYFKKG